MADFDVESSLGLEVARFASGVKVSMVGCSILYLEVHVGLGGLGGYFIRSGWSWFGEVLGTKGLLEEGIGMLGNEEATAEV